MKSILLYASEDAGCDSRLLAAVDLTRALGGHLTCVQASPLGTFVFADPMGGSYDFATVVEQMRDASEAQRGRMEQRLRQLGVEFDWIAEDGSPAEVLAGRSKLADVIVLSLGGGSDRSPLSLAGDVTVHSRTPVLAVPAKGARLDCAAPAVVAWNGSPEASHALRLAVPLLRQAASVHLLSFGETPVALPAAAAARYLEWHGVPSQVHQQPLESRSVAGALIDMAGRLSAGIIVAGAYGHSRLREAVLGGATRELLNSSPLPLFLAH